MSQPVWRLIANLGDANPFDYGGYFVYRDETGVYPEEAEFLVLEDENDENSKYTIYRIILDRCTYVNGVLSDNKFHPEHPAWFAEPESEKANRPQDTTYLSNVCSCMDVGYEQLVQMFCSADPLERAWAYRDVAEYHGWENFDSDPLTGLTREEVKARYKEKNNPSNSPVAS